LRLRYSGILIIFLVIVALAVSGCSGGSSTTNPTPTVGPGSPGGDGTPTPAAGQTTGGTPDIKSLFDMDKLKSYEWKITSVTEGKSNVTYFRFEKNTGVTYNGVAANEDKMTVTMDDSTVMKFDVFYSPTDNRQLGGSVQMGDFQMPITADSQYSSMFDAYDVSDTYSTSDWLLTSKGPDTLLINGKTYICNKYWVGDAGGQGTVWVSNGVPMPVKIESKTSDGSSWTYELWDWDA
jgi:hypothetical protein